MTPEQKSAALIRARDIALATIDYIAAGVKSDLDDETFIHVKADFDRQQRKIKACCQQGKLSVLYKKLNLLLEGPIFRCDLLFSVYIHEKTGYSIDMFKSVRKRGDTILRKGVIKNEKELGDAGILLRLYNHDIKKAKQSAALKLLMIEFGTSDASRSQYKETIIHTISTKNEPVKITTRTSKTQRGDIHEVTITEISKSRGITS